MAFIEICLRNVWLLKIKSKIGPLSVIGASTLVSSRQGSFQKTVTLWDLCESPIRIPKRQGFRETTLIAKLPNTGSI
jgi:hypothetical protein